MKKLFSSSCAHCGIMSSKILIHTSDLETFNQENSGMLKPRGGMSASEQDDENPSWFKA